MHTVLNINIISNILTYLSTCLIVALSSLDEGIIQIEKHSAYRYI